jgi:hypothetical protein
MPVIAFSAEDPHFAHAAQEQAAQTKSYASIDSLVAAVRERLASHLHPQRRVE